MKSALPFLLTLGLLAGCTEIGRSLVFAVGLDDRKEIGEPITLRGTR